MAKCKGRSIKGINNYVYKEIKVRRRAFVGIDE